MRHKTRKTNLAVWAACVMLALAAAVGTPLAQAQDGANAWTSYDLNMRTGPGATYDSITVLPGGTGLVLEARNADTSWLLAHTEDNAARGWVSALYLRYQEGFNAFNLGVSGEIVGAAAPAPAPGAPPAENPAPAPGGVTAYTVYNLNVRSGPGTQHSTVAQVAGGTGLVLEARNPDSSWVLAHTQDGTVRGWLASLYLEFTISAASLPTSDEIIGGGGPSAPAGVDTNVTYQGINMGGYDPARVEGIDLAAFPVVARATARSRTIFLEGREMGNHANVLAKVGDCSSEHWFFLKSFAWGQYDLGAYANLQGVINHFGESLAYDSQATHNGYNVNSVMHPMWADPSVCESGESPLECEYRLHMPSVSVIMFGTSDLLVMTPYEFDFYMRNIVNITIQHGVIPVLSTFPGNQGFPNHTILYNQIVVRIALDYDVPLINLWLALEALPNEGLEPDGFHLSNPLDGNSSCVLLGNNLKTGYPTRNLVTLQSLDEIWRNAMQ